jgi:FdhE protein
MTAPGTALTGLKRQRPEWEPWLAVVEHIVDEIGSRTWSAVVPAAADTRETTAPLLAGAMLALPANAIRRVFERTIRIASRSGTPAMATLRSAVDRELDVLTLFRASVCQDGDAVKNVATARGIDAGALQAVTALVAVPFLHACRHHWASSISQSWVEGYCPVCGAWPAFAEVRGIERSRCYRCGRCGGAWHARLLHCPYCTLYDHDELVSLVPKREGSHSVIDACKGCLGYVKTFTRLQACPPDTVMLEDLTSVDLDIAALEQGFARPTGAGYPLEIIVTDSGAPRRFFGWKT